MTDRKGSMMMKIALGITLAATLLLVSGCGEVAPADTSSTVQTESEAGPTAAADELAETPTAAPTGPGDVCDPSNLNDSICAAFYPEQVILNLTSAPRAREPLASMSAEQKIDLATKACEHLAAGGVADTVTLVDTIPLPDDPQMGGNRNNGIVFTAGALAYCNESLDAQTRAFVDHYKGIGEEASKESFKNREMPDL